MMMVVLLSPFLVQFDDSALSAKSHDEHDLVGILVASDLYNVGKEDGGDLTGKIYRYTSDVQSSLHDTKALILPVNSEESPQRIFDVLEKLYLEGYLKEDSLFFLRGVVIIGDVPLPLVKETVPFVSVFPYTDFEDPSYLWDAEQKMFIPNDADFSKTSDIWHGIIRGTPQEISAYFDKDHEFHKSLAEGKAPYDDSVLYVDFAEESDTLSDTDIAQYKNTEKYTEDLAYMRYNKYLLEELQKGILDEVEIPGDKKDEISDQIESLFGEGKRDLIPDIFTKDKIDGFLPEYLKIVSSYSAKVQKRIEGSGRWSQSNTDTIPGLITAMDALSREGMKHINDVLQEEILNFVETKWQKNVTMVENISAEKFVNPFTISNKLHGRSVETIQKAEECSIFRGSPLGKTKEYSELVEYNRLYDPASSGKKEDQCDPYGGCCIQNREEPAKCRPEDAEKDVFSLVGNTPSSSGNEASFRDCQKLEYLVKNDEEATFVNAQKKEISSAVVHDAPRPEDIQNAAKSLTAGHIPSDGIRHLTFQGQSGMLERIDFFNAFSLAEIQTSDVWEAFLNAVREKEEEIEQKIIEDNLRSYAQYLFLKTKDQILTRAISLEFPADFQQEFLAYRNDIETFLSQKFPDAKNGAALWKSAILVQESGNSEISKAAEAIFSKHFTFAREGAEGPNIKNIFQFWKQKEVVLTRNIIAAGTIREMAEDIMRGAKYPVQNFSFRWTALPEEGFLVKKAEEMDSPALRKSLSWGTKDIHEKHADAVATFFDSKTTGIPRHKENGIALAYFRGKTDDASLEWNGAEETVFDPEWNALQEEIGGGSSPFGGENPSNNGNSGENNNGGDGQSNSDEDCPSAEGASLLEWPKAIKCWLDHLQDKKIEFTRVCAVSDVHYGDIPYIDPKTGKMVEPLSQSEPTQVFLTSSQAALLPGMEGVISGQILDSDGIQTSAGGRQADVFIEGPAEFTGVDLDPEKLGIQLFITTGEFQIPFRALQVGDIHITLEMEELPKAEIVLSVIETMHVSLETKSVTPEQNGLTLFEVGAEIVDADGNLLSNASPEADLAVSDPRKALLGRSTGQFVGGTLKIPVALRSGPIELSISLPAGEKASIELGKNSSDFKKIPVKLQFGKAPQVFPPNSQVKIPLSVLFSSGEISTEAAQFPKDLQIGITNATKKLGEVSRSGNSLILTVKDRPGKLRIFAKAQNVLPAAMEITIGTEMSNKFFEKVTPNAYITEFFGIPTAHPLQEESLARKMLFSGKTLFYTGLSEAPEISLPRASLDKNGGVIISDSGIENVISSLTPLTLSIFDTNSFENLVEYKPILPSETNIQIGPPDLEKPGIFFENFDTANVLRSEESGGIITVFMREIPILTVSSALNFDIRDQKFSLEFNASESKGKIVLNLLLELSTIVGKFIFSSANISLISSPHGKTAADGSVYVFDDSQKVPLLSGPPDIISQNEDGIAWEGDALTNLFIASGETVGESMKHLGSPILTNWGDPTLHLLAPHAGTNGFDRTLGTPIFSSGERNIQQVENADIDGDGRDDLIITTEGSTLLFLQNTGDGNFRKWGTLLASQKDIWDVAPLAKGDGFADVLVLDGDGKLQFFQNSKEVFSEEPLKVFQNIRAESLASKDLDGDSFSDVILQKKNGEILVYYGSADGYSDEHKTKLGSVGAKYSHENIPGEFLISFPDIQKKGLPLQTFSYSNEKNEKISEEFADADFFKEREIIKTGEDVNGGMLERGDRVQFKISIPVQKERISLIDMVSLEMTYKKGTLTCDGCDTETVINEPASGATYLQITNIPAQKNITINYEMEIRTLPKVDFMFGKIQKPGFPNDTILDITLLLPGTESDGVIEFISTGPRTYQETFRKNEQEETPKSLPDMTDSDENGTPDQFEKDDNGNKIPDILEDAKDNFSGDDDHDGIPNIWDRVSSEISDFFSGDLDDMNRKLGDLINSLENSNWCLGGCVALPVNYAFFAPGPINISQALLNARNQILLGGKNALGGMQNSFDRFGGEALSSELGNLQGKIDGIMGSLKNGVGVTGPKDPGFPIFGLTPKFPFVCAGPACFADSYFRLYIAPTITGGTGIAVCPGKHPSKACFPTALPLLALTGICDEINEAIQNALSRANSAVSSDSGNSIAYVVDPGNSAASRSGNIQVVSRLGTLKWDSSLGNNIAPESSPTFFSRWAAAQIREFGKIFKLSSITVFYPALPNAFVNDSQRSAIQKTWEDFTKQFDNFGKTAKKSNESSAGAKTPEKFTESTREKIQRFGRDQVKSAYDTIAPVSKIVKDAGETVESIEDIYKILRSVPLLDIREKIIPIAVPTLSKEQMYAGISDFDLWLKEADQEIADWKDFVTKWECPRGYPKDKCADAKKAWKKMSEEVDVAYSGMSTSLEHNKKVLESYANLGNIVSFYEQEFAKYVFGIVCYVDAITDLMDGWFQRNSERAKSWIRFFKTAREILKEWQNIVKMLDEPMKKCNKCTTDNYETGGTVFDIVFGSIPTPPVVEFPKLPNIVLDVSQIKAALTVEVPRLEFYPLPIALQALPRLKLPRVPTVTLVIPDIKRLDALEPFQKLPDFPDLPIPKLPDIPPPPSLPTVTGDLSKIMELANKLLKIWCIFGKFFVHDENQLKPIIESLTSRPANVLLGIDFLNVAFPKNALSKIDDSVAKIFDVGSIDEIHAVGQMNLTLKYDGITKKVQELADKWNNFLVEKNLMILKAIQEKFDFGNVLDFRDDLNFPEHIIIDPKDAGDQGDKVPSLPIPSEPVKPLSFGIEESMDTLRTLLKNTEFTNFEVIAEKYGIPKTNLSDFSGSSSQKYLVELKDALQKREKRSVLNVKNLLAHNGDLQVLLAGNSDITLSKKPDEIASLGNPLSAKPELVFPPDQNEDSALGFPKIETEDVLRSVPELPRLGETPKQTSGQYIRNGIFVYDESTQKSQKIVAYEGITSEVRNMLFSDVDKDGDDDVLLITGKSIFLKENGKHIQKKTPFSFPPEVGSFESFLPHNDAIKNITLSSSYGEISGAFRFENDPKNIGVEIELKNALTGYARITETETKYIEILRPENLEQNLELDHFFLGPTSLSFSGEEIQIGEHEAAMVSILKGASFSFPIEKGFWTLRMRYIQKDGSRGTRSQPVLVSSATGNDVTAPIFVGDGVKKIPVLLKKTISAEGVYDFESGMTFEWDLDGDGKADATGFEIPVGPYPEPEQKNILLTAKDAGGNILRIPIVLDIFVPDITLEKDPLQTGTTLGNVDPRLSEMPFALLRERLNTWKMIRTESADKNGRYFTDRNGKYEISDLHLSPDAIIKDQSGEIIARVSGTNGRVFLEKSEYKLDVFPGDGTHFTRTVILNSKNEIVANVVYASPSGTDVFLSPQEISARNVETLSGVNLYDRNKGDAIQFGGLPVDAPSYAGGGAIFDQDSGTVIALISHSGDVHLLSSDAKISLRGAQNPETDPILYELKYKGTSIFDMYVRTDFPNIILHHGENWTTRSSGPVLFISHESRIALKDDLPEAAVGLEKVKDVIDLPFSDVDKSNPNFEAIKMLYDRKILQGYGDGTFRPDEKLIRAEFVKIVLGATLCADCTRPSEFELKRFFEPFPFPDVPLGVWYEFCVAKAKKLKIIFGYGDGNFKPLRNISRAEALAIILRAADIELDKQVDSGESLLDVPDYAWYEHDIFTGVNLGIIPVHEGGRVFPDEEVTRGEFAMMAKKLLDVADCREKDTDKDGLPDYSEIDAGLDEKDASDAGKDSDGDGFSNLDEYRAGTNPRDEHDFPGKTEPDDTFDHDKDHDGVKDDVDNCPDTSNLTQEDSDGDLIGDACDAPEISENDSDGDSLPDRGDNCPFSPNSDQSDTDKDGIGDACENVVDGGETDKCPFLPEDIDGVDDSDGCPEEIELPDFPPGVHIFPGDPLLCGLLDFLADIRSGDLIKSVILNERNSKIFSESETYSLENIPLFPKNL